MAIVLVIAAVLAIGVAIRASGMRPYGEQAILRQIDQEDGALCIWISRDGAAIRGLHACARRSQAAACGTFGCLLVAVTVD
jgi:hypothetical protein